MSASTTPARKYWLDNLRWVTVLLVLLYHVFYFYNNKGVFGGIGGFGEWPQVKQYQDVVMYILYPWFMPLLFLVAGISAHYALERHSGKEWFRSRTRKLLVPGTIGLFVFHWMTGYFNTAVAARTGVFDGMRRRYTESLSSSLGRSHKCDTSSDCSRYAGRGRTHRSS
ncbi:MAG: acyltransferase family protein [Bacteroidales bacterium]|nr:acyltransferase family protein [Bacteroidales bacterium]